MDELETKEASGREISAAAFPTSPKPVFMKVGFLMVVLIAIVSYLLWERTSDEEPSPIIGDPMDVINDGHLQFRDEYDIGLSDEP
ncbi:MAG: hypothetical protein KDD66_03750 [Bdellovibrionales bacterium]|nr:hypothetical protein [Bdellovibrionales bacterium]